jgi:hypothetical protein
MLGIDVKAIKAKVASVTNILRELFMSLLLHFSGAL